MSKKNIFEPAIIGGIEVKNRIFRSATYGAHATENKPSSKMIEVYENLSKGDIGLVIFGYTVFSSTDHYGKNVGALKDDSISALKNVTDINTKLVEGSFFDSKLKNQILIGQKLANKLKIKIKSKLKGIFKGTSNNSTGFVQTTPQFYTNPSRGHNLF